MSKNPIDNVLSELLSKQLNKIDKSKKLDYRDIVRLRKHIDKSIFNKDECVLWKGYITNLNKKEKGAYINFFYKKKKYALHRLLYINYIGLLYDDEYLKFTCDNKGCCCNINHLTKTIKEDIRKIDKNNRDIENEIENETKNKINNEINNETNLVMNLDEDEFIVDFE